MSSVAKLVALLIGTWSLGSKIKMSSYMCGNPTLQIVVLVIIMQFLMTSVEECAVSAEQQLRHH
jgi:hypothetical protein